MDIVCKTLYTADVFLNYLLLHKILEHVIARYVLNYTVFLIFKN